MVKNDYLCVGKVVGSRGINGEIKIEPWCDSPEDFLEIKRFFTDVNKLPIDVTDLRIHKSQVLMKIKNINDKNSAESLRGKFIYAFKKDVPLKKDHFFIEDLKGLQVLDTQSGTFYGTLKDVLHTGANDIYVIADSKNNEYLVPIIDRTVSDIDLEGGKIFISPIKGVFDAN